MKKFILAGASLNSGNRGVNALTRSMIMFILDKYGENSEINILSYTISGVINNIVTFQEKDIIIKEELCIRKRVC